MWARISDDDISPCFSIVTSTRPDPPTILLRLNEPGIRNHARQKEEQLIKAKQDFEKHQRSFHKMQTVLRVDRNLPWRASAPKPFFLRQLSTQVIFD
jgi:hypothetical protein